LYRAIEFRISLIERLSDEGEIASENVVFGNNLFSYLLEIFQLAVISTFLALRQDVVLKDKMMTIKCQLFLKSLRSICGHPRQKAEGMHLAGLNFSVHHSRIFQRRTDEIRVSCQESTVTSHHEPRFDGRRVRKFVAESGGH
jgi:hypothetical protein